MEEKKMTEQLPYIHKTKKKVIGGQTIEETTVTVQGHLLTDCEKIFDKKWKAKED